MRRVLISIGKILAFILLFAGLTAAVIMTAVAFGGEAFYAIRHVSVEVEFGLMLAVLIPLVIMARFVDKRALTTIGFGPPRFYDLVIGALLGAAI
jgi:hypothetical protein